VAAATSTTSTLSKSVIRVAMSRVIGRSSPPPSPWTSSRSVDVGRARHAIHPQVTVIGTTAPPCAHVVNRFVGLFTFSATPTRVSITRLGPIRQP
jgi:hypothetical protein